MSATATPAHPRSSRRLALHLRATQPLALAALTLLALVLRLSQIDQSLLGDEYFSYQDIAGRSFGAVLSTVHAGGENSPPLFFLLAWITAKLGDPTVWLRLPSMLLGAATVPVVYVLGRESVGRIAGMIAAGVIAVAPFTVFYGIEARPYATMTFFVAISTLALLRAMRTGARGWWALYVLAATAAAYSHYTCVFVLGVQALWSLWRCRERIGPALVSNVLIGVFYLPWLPQLRGKALAVIGSLYPLGVSRVLGDLLRPIPGHPAAPLRAIPTIAGLIAFALIVVAGLAALGRRWHATPGRRLVPRADSDGALIVALAFATPVGLLLYSLLATDLWLPRGLSASIPAAALALGALVAALPRRVAVAAVLAIAVTLLAGTARSLGPAYDRGPYRTLANYLDRVARPPDPIVLATYAGAGPLLVQFKHAHTIVRKPALWSHIGAGGTGYMVLDEQIARFLHVSTVPPAGFVLIARRHYGGGLATDLLTYRRRPAEA